jgi:hypothetical protein
MGSIVGGHMLIVANQVNVNHHNYELLSTFFLLKSNKSYNLNMPYIEKIGVRNISEP